MTQLLKQCGWFKDSAHPRQETIKDMTRAMIGKDCCSWSVAKVTSKSLQLHELHHIRLLCHLLSPRICSNSCPLSWWCYLTISSSVALFSSCPQSFPTSVSFPVSQFLASGGQSIDTSASASVLPMHIQGWFLLGLTSWSYCCSRDSQESSPAPQFKSINFWCSAFFMVQLSHLYVTTWKTIALTLWTFIGKAF